MTTIRTRLPWLAGLMVLGFIALEARLATLHLDDSASTVAVDNALRTRRLDAPRGRILDRRGEVMADVRPTIDLRVRPHYVDDKEALRLTLLPRLSEAELERFDDAMLADGWDARRAWVIAPDVDRATRAWVSGNRPFLSGVDLGASQQRQYPLGSIAPHALGYVAEVTADDLLRLDRSRYRAGDYTGRQGIERLLEDELRGIPGIDATITTSVGGRARGSGPWFDRLTALADNWDVPVRGGGDITLTLDQNLQAVAETSMDDRRGAVVMMDVNSGAVLAYVSSPDFEPGELVDGISRAQWRGLIGDPANPLMDRVSRGLYPPASTFKMVTAAAALEAGISENHTVRCTGHTQVGNRRFKCWKRGGHGYVDLSAALAGSCDAWFYDVGLTIGHEAIAEAARRLGFGSRTGLALNGERQGLLPSDTWMRERYGHGWTMGDTASASIGQSITQATPLQLAVMTSTIAAGGMRPSPYIVESVTRPDGSTARIGGQRASVDTGFSPEIWASIQAGMERVVERGTGRGVKTEGLPMAGKTGTAQTVSGALKKLRPGYETEDHALFVAYAPTENPQVAISVIVEHAGGGSTHAAPVARDVLVAWAIREGILPDPETLIDEANIADAEGQL